MSKEEGNIGMSVKIPPGVWNKYDANRQTYEIYEKAYEGSNDDWKAYFDEVLRKGSGWSPHLNDKHQYSTIPPIQKPPELEKCRCTNEGPWPHLMHSGDPVSNFHSDILIYIWDILQNIQLKVNDIPGRSDPDGPNQEHPDKSKSAAESSTDLAKALKPIIDKLDDMQKQEKSCCEKTHKKLDDLNNKPNGGGGGNRIPNPTPNTSMKIEPPYPTQFSKEAGSNKAPPGKPIKPDDKPEDKPVNPQPKPKPPAPAPNPVPPKPNPLPPKPEDKNKEKLPDPPKPPVDPNKQPYDLPDPPKPPVDPSKET